MTPTIQQLSWLNLSWIIGIFRICLWFFMFPLGSVLNQCDICIPHTTCIIQPLSPMHTHNVIIIKVCQMLVKLSNVSERLSLCLVTVDSFDWLSNTITGLHVNQTMFITNHSSWVFDYFVRDCIYAYQTHSHIGRMTF